ncbi:MAG: response regulator transcription factor [Epsilonproteobacteria bacterium]|nr:response regulator transcription factor [Campylobacterota bacterium]
MKILLLEDNQTLNETIKLKLEIKGYSVSSYINGEEAFNNIMNGFSCFVLDINTPIVDGIKILRKIREFYENVPVIIISSIDELDTIKKSYKFGCNDYLKKPFYIDELEIKIEKLCKITKKKIFFDEDSFFDFDKNIISVSKIKKTLTKKENLLMNLFLINKNELITYETIQNYVWEGEYASFDAIRGVIKRLKNKLTKPYIKAHFSRGYSFISAIGKIK